MSIGVPVKILHEAEGHVITCETTDGQTYRGTLSEAEDSMNIHMSNVQVTNRDGSISAVPNIVIRGSKVVFLILPDMLKHAPVFKTRTGAGRSQPAPTITTGGARRGRK